MSFLAFLSEIRGQGTYFSANPDKILLSRYGRKQEEQHDDKGKSEHSV